MKLEPDDFTAWRDNPVTQAVFKALRMKAVEAKAMWVASSWESGKIEAETLADLRARHEAWTDICDLTLEQLEAILGEG